MPNELTQERVRAALKGLEAYIVDMGPLHDEDCPEDDTCECSEKFKNAGANDAYRILSELDRELQQRRAAQGEPRTCEMCGETVNPDSWCRCGSLNPSSMKEPQGQAALVRDLLRVRYDCDSCLVKNVLVDAVENVACCRGCGKPARLVGIEATAGQALVREDVDLDALAQETLTAVINAREWERKSILALALARAAALARLSQEPKP